MKRIALIATGGTIAGQSTAGAPGAYLAGALAATDWLAAVPGLATLATIVPEEPFRIDSKDAGAEHWRALADCAARALADPAIAGVVIAHGTDTLEESAYFLHLTLPPGKPLVLTGAMRPADAPAADGPANLRQAVAVAATGITQGLGAVVVFNGEIHAAREVAKIHTRNLHAFASPNAGPLGDAEPPYLRHRPTANDAGACQLSHADAPLPEVALLTVASGDSPKFLQALDDQTAGLVVAFPGHGSVPERWRAPLQTLVARGVIVIRASRVGAGPVLADDIPWLWPAGDLAPLKARVALIAALASGNARRFREIAAAQESAVNCPPVSMAVEDTEARQGDSSQAACRLLLSDARE